MLDRINKKIYNNKSLELFSSFILLSVFYLRGSDDKNILL